MAQPKYQLLQQWLRDQINSGEYTANQQIPTELELAEQFGYSRQTIRQAISGLEQEGLLKRTPGRGTFVCQQNAGRVNRSESRTRRVGVLTTYLDDYIFPGIINGIERVLSRHDYLFTLGLTHNKTLDEATALQKLLAAGVDGLIIEGTKTALPTPNEGMASLGSLRKLLNCEPCLRRQRQYQYTYLAWQPLLFVLPVSVYVEVYCR